MNQISVNISFQELLTLLAKDYKLVYIVVIYLFLSQYYTH